MNKRQLKQPINFNNYNMKQRDLKNKNWSVEMYNTPLGIKKYTDCIKNIGLWESEKKVFKKYVDKSAKILELGCGAGRATFNLYDIGYKNIVGLDLAKNLIKYAKIYAKKNNYKITFINGDSCNLNFLNNSFDVVFYSFNGLQLIPGYENRLKVLKGVYRILKKDGIFIFTAHNRDTKEFKSYWNKENCGKTGKMIKNCTNLEI